MKPKKTTKKAAKKKTTKKKKVVKKKPTTVTVASPAHPDIKVTLASELADDEMIEKEMMGEVLPYYIYTFEQEGKTVTGLSLKGVNEVVRRLNKDPKTGTKIRLNPDYLTKEEKTYEDHAGVEVSVFAEDLVTGNSAWGIKFEPYYKVGRKGKYKNTFAVEKALSKAERNAKRKLIPETLAVKMIEKLIAEDPKNVKKLAPPPPQHHEHVPPPAKPTDPEAIKNLVRRGIATAKDEARVLEFDRRTQESKEFDDAFKKEVRDLCATRLDEIKK